MTKSHQIYRAMEIPSLLKLMVSQNNLIEIDVDFCEKAVQLQFLNLSHNEITLNQNVFDNYWSKDLVNCNNLNEVDLNHNFVSKFPYWDRKGFDFRIRRKVHLEFNNITEIDVSEKIKIKL